MFQSITQFPVNEAAKLFPWIETWHPSDCPIGRKFEASDLAEIRVRISALHCLDA